MPVFGAPQSKDAETFALSLGDALQLTNILRDVEEDALDGRLYLPRELLEHHGCAPDPGTISDDSGLPRVREDLAQYALQKFADVRAVLPSLDWRLLRPALLMMGVYERYLELMIARGWENGQPKPTLSKFEKAAIAARWFVAPKISS
ncbi:MAG: squalene/phytoene synthase family protein, partial [Pseudomonadota bacterium]